MRLGFHYHIPAIQKGDSIYMPGYLGVFLDSLASNCESIISFMHDPLPSEVKNLGYKMRSPNIQLVNIGFHASVPKRLINTMKIRKRILAYENELDTIIIRTPTPLIHVFSKTFTIPVTLLLIGDHSAGINQLQQPWWRKKIILLFIIWNNKHQLKIAKNTIVFAASESLYEKIQPIAYETTLIQTTTLSTKDIFIRNDTCQAEMINILFVGRFDRTKGLFELYETLAHLKQDSTKEYHLNLVGWAIEGDGILEELATAAEKLNIVDMISNLGYKKLGSDLFDVYRKADIYAMPTKFDEFGRTLWEAMAHSLPVVSTNVGSIPVKLTNGTNAILVDPGDSKIFADAIEKVATNKELRKKLIKNGRELAEKNTLEIQSKKMITELENYIK